MTKNNPQTDQPDLELLNLRVKAGLEDLEKMKDPRTKTEPLDLFLQYYDLYLVILERNYWETVFLITNNTEKLDKIEKNDQKIIENQQKIIEKLDKIAEKPSFWGKIKGIFSK